jgi:nitroreductase
MGGDSNTYGRGTEIPVSNSQQIEPEAAVETKFVEPAEGADWNIVEQVMLRRRSVRKYKKKQVPAYLIRRTLEVARYAPSEGNCQPWKFVVVRDAAMIQEMETFCVAVCKQMSSELNYTIYPPGSPEYIATREKVKQLNRSNPNDLHPIPIFAATAIAQGRFAVFHAAPTVILLLEDKRGIGRPVMDVAICGEHIVLAAQSFGLGTCWVNFAMILNSSPEWCSCLGVEEPYTISSSIVVGYPVGNPSRPVARDTHEIAWFEGGKKQVLF